MWLFGLMHKLLGAAVYQMQAKKTEMCRNPATNEFSSSLEPMQRHRAATHGQRLTRVTKDTEEN